MRNLNKKITSNKTKHLVVENEFKELQIFDSNLFNGQSYFNNDGAQFFLIFQPIYKTISPYKANKTLSPKLIWMSSSKIRLRFKGSCLKQDKASFTSNNVVNLHSHELDRWSQDVNAKFTLKNCLLENVEITKNTDPNKYSYSGYGIGFDPHSLLSIPNFDWG